MNQYKGVGAWASRCDRLFKAFPMPLPVSCWTMRSCIRYNHRTTSANQHAIKVSVRFLKQLDDGYGSPCSQPADLLCWTWKQKEGRKEVYLNVLIIIKEPLECQWVDIIAYSNRCYQSLPEKCKITDHPFVIIKRLIWRWFLCIWRLLRWVSGPIPWNLLFRVQMRKAILQPMVALLTYLVSRMSCSRANIRKEISSKTMSGLAIHRSCVCRSGLSAHRGSWNLELHNRTN